MSYDKLRNVSKVEIAVGIKETTKALRKDKVGLVFIAQDAEERITSPVRTSCIEKDIPIEVVDSMKRLGRACGIVVGCAVAALLEK
ncbi:MAG: ribosomal L7Ae/L30e/S12e/Gadd45 family protein [Clostridiales bacterium]|nr:ribosomal L7Ae/L30e/S12e/Gadd45 family protein [Clostridiales bacterium]MCF8023560.1 ribosomal L7Ae/L30e/S12e/Gadd45 family protein [Clostridiales bacterium]